MTEPPEPYPAEPLPPPPGGYPPPPPGGYPPPPPPGGYPPPPPPGGYPPPPPGGYPPPLGYGPAPGYPARPPGYPGGPFSVGDAFNWAWNRFARHAVALIVPIIVYGVLIAVVVALAAGPQISLDSGVAAVVLVVVYVLVFLASAYVQMAYLSGCLDIADGKPVTVGSFFTPRNFGPGVGAALLVGLLTAIGWLLLIIPGLIFGFLAQFTIAFVIDRSLWPIDALKASIATATNNVGGALLSYLVQIAVLLVGQLLCGLGLFVAFPVAVLIQTYTYRLLSGGAVVPAQ